MGNVERSRLWRSGRVPFVIDNRDFSTTGHATTVQRAVAHWNTRSILQLEPRRSSDPDFLVFREHSTACQSKVGRRGGEQAVLCDLDSVPARFTQASVIHEIGHAVGLYHEHQRPDRDRFVRVVESNVTTVPLSNFDICGEAVGPYDFESIMHYSANGAGTGSLVPLRGERLGMATGLSSLDARTITMVYGRVPGNLLWYRHAGAATGASRWSLDVNAKTGQGDVGLKLGAGWEAFRIVTASSSGVIYAVEGDGDLVWYRQRRYQDGLQVWADGGRFGVPGVDYRLRIGSGWNRFHRVFATSQGVIYGIDPSGGLFWYRHFGHLDGKAAFKSDGTQGVAGVDYGLRIGTGWNRFQHVFASSDGTIYAIEANGDLLWYRHTGFLTGAATWRHSTGVRVGSGWNRFRRVFAADRGILYGVEQNGDLRWYRHSGFAAGLVGWTPPVGKVIGTGWDSFDKVLATDDGVIYGVVA